MGKIDSNMRAKILKVRKYDTAARRERLAMDTIQDARQRARNSKPVAKYVIVRDNGKLEKFATHAAMAARRDVLGAHVIYVRCSESPNTHEIPIYVVNLRGGRRLKFYDRDNAVARLDEADAIDMLCFPSMERISA